MYSMSQKNTMKIHSTGLSVQMYSTRLTKWILYTKQTQEAKYVERWPSTTSAWAGWSRFDIPVDRYGGVHSLLICTSTTLWSPTCHQASQQENTYWAKYQKVDRASTLVTLWNRQYPFPCHTHKVDTVWLYILVYYQSNVILYCYTTAKYVLLCGCTIAILYSCTTALLHYCPTVLLHCCTTILLYHCIIVLLLYCTTALFTTALLCW